MSLQISVVMPTHNNSPILPRTLNALAQQTINPACYELILVADGCRDDTVTKARSLNLPFKLTVLEQAGLGAATARNRGAALAQAPLILFLDDDMEAGPGLIEGHLAAHKNQPNRVVLGYFPLPTLPPHADIFQLAIKLWWDESFYQRAQPEYRFSYKDLCTGNVSLPRALFEAVGGFDERFPAASTEDYELGVRLHRRQANFVFAPEAFSIHHDSPSPERSLRRAFADGRGHALLTKKYPLLFDDFGISKPPTSLALKIVWPLIWNFPALFKPLNRLLLNLVHLARAGRMSGLMWGFYGLLDGFAYWSGVKTELESIASLSRFAQTIPLQMEDFCELTLDIATDYEHLADILSQRPTDAIKLLYKGKFVGYIPPVFGAEALRPVHVKQALLNEFAGALFKLLQTDEPSAAQLKLPAFEFEVEAVTL